jgi:hypothetical protein
VDFALEESTRPDLEVVNEVVRVVALPDGQAGATDIAG